MSIEWPHIPGRRHCNAAEPVMKDHLPWKTVFLWVMGWTFMAGYTAYPYDITTAFQHNQKTIRWNDFSASGQNLHLSINTQLLQPPSLPPQNDEFRNYMIYIQYIQIKSGFYKISILSYTNYTKKRISCSDQKADIILFGATAVGHIFLNWNVRYSRSRYWQRGNFPE